MFKPVLILLLSITHTYITTCYLVSKVEICCVNMFCVNHQSLFHALDYDLNVSYLYYHI